MYIMTGFMTLVHSYIQVTARSIDYILFVRALGVSMWKQTWLKGFNLNIPLFLTQTLHHKMLKLLCKIKKNFWPVVGCTPCFAREIIAKLLYDDNSNVVIWWGAKIILGVTLVEQWCHQFFRIYFSSFKPNRGFRTLFFQNGVEISNKPVTAHGNST